MRLIECTRCGAQEDMSVAGEWGELVVPAHELTSILCPACVDRALEKPETGTHPFAEVKGACGVCGSARFTSLHPAAVVRQVPSA